MSNPQAFSPSQSEELSNIHLRRSEKKILNAINRCESNNEVRFHVPDAKNAAKPAQRIATPAHKILILVRSFERSELARHDSVAIRYPELLPQITIITSVCMNNYQLLHQKQFHSSFAEFNKHG